MIVVGDVVGNRGNLGFGAGERGELEIMNRDVFRESFMQWIIVTGLGCTRARQRSIVLNHAFQGFPRQVETIERGVAPLQLGQDPQSLGVMVEAAVGSHDTVERLLPRVPEGWVPEIVRQRQCFRKVFVQTKCTGDGSRDLCDFQGMCQTRAIVIAFMVDEHLGLVLEPSEGRRMEYPVAVALKRCPGFTLRFRVKTPPARCRIACVCCRRRRADARNAVHEPGHYSGLRSPAMLFAPPLTLTASW